MDKERLVELVGNARNGDKNSLAELFYNYKDAVYFTAGKLLGSVEAAESVVRETTEIMLRKLSVLETPESYFAWIRMIADSVIVKKLGAGFSERLSKPVSASTSVGDASAVSKESFDTPEVRSMLVSLVDTLPDDLKLCAYMFYFQRLAVENIAKVLGVEKNEATARLYAALNDIESAAREHDTANGRLSAAPAWLIASALQESSARFALTKERSFELLNEAAKAAYAVKTSPEDEPQRSARVYRAEGAAQPEQEDEEEDIEEEDLVPARKEKSRRAKKKSRRDEHEDEDDEDEDEDDDYDDEDGDRPGFFSTVWGKILIAFIALAIVGAAAAIFLPKILGKSDSADQTQQAASDAQTAEPETQTAEPEVQDAAITADKLAATYYGYYTDAENKSGKVSTAMTLSADGSWSAGDAKGTYVYDTTSMKATLTTDDGTSTEWNCWLDEANIVLSQKVASSDTASTVYNYYQSEQLRDDALAKVDTTAG